MVLEFEAVARFESELTIAWQHRCGVHVSAQLPDFVEGDVSHATFPNGAVKSNHTANEAPTAWTPSVTILRLPSVSSQ